MRVITLCDGASITGGAEKVAITTAVELQKRGIESAFFGAEGDLDSLIVEAGLQAETLGLQDAYHTESKSELIKRFFWNKEARVRWARFLDDFDPADTVVHVHSFRRIFSTSVMAETFARGFPTVCTLHDFGMVCPNTSFYNFPNQAICHLTPNSPACYLSQCTKKGWPMKAMQMGRSVVVRHERVANKIDQFVAPSEFSARIMVPLLPADAKVEVIYSPVKLDKPVPADLSKNDTFVFVGRFQPEKDPVLFAEAAKLAGVKAMFVGDGPEMDRVRAVLPDAEYTGWLKGAAVTDKVRSARAVVMPSRWYETAGLAAIDSLSHGVPVIVSDLCAATEFVLDNVNGLHFTGTNVEDLAAKLRQMTGQKSVELGSAAYDRYWANPFTVEDYLTKLIALYGEVLGTKKTSLR